MKVSIGDRFSHRIHGAGTVIAVHPASNSVRIKRDSNGYVDYAHLRTLNSDWHWKRLA